jgi:hypothetical protein
MSSSSSTGVGLSFFALALSLQYVMLKKVSTKTKKQVILSGGCHCKRVRFNVTASNNLVTWVCNCSICDMRKNWHFIVPSSSFQLIQGADNLSHYTFNTGRAKHFFCKTCGITSFYTPRSNPDGVAVTTSCLDNTSECEIVYRHFDGTNWEDFYSGSGISQFSKT